MSRSDADHGGPFLPDWTVPPGETIRDFLEEAGWSENFLAMRMGWSIDDTQKLLAGEIRIDGSTAYLLSTVLGSSPQFWTNRQTQYEQDMVRLGRVKPLK